MTRHFVLGNGTILVGMDRFGQVKDFFYPYVGQENHVNGKTHKLGIWVDGKFSWLTDWQPNSKYKHESLVTDIHYERDGIEITFNDAVHPEKNVLIREVKVRNKTTANKDFRLFFHQQFEISEANLGDTVYYNPIIKSLIHYKGKRNFLMNGCVGNGKSRKGITEYATGLVGEYGREGTYKDAEDGTLSNNPIEHGSVDSTASLHFNVSPGSEKEVCFWICVGEKYQEIAALNEWVLKQKPKKLILEIEEHWKKWVNRTDFKYPKLSKDVIDLFKRSLLIINTQVDKGGSIIASSDSEMLHLRKDTYSYMWPRDGALIARSLDRAGYQEITGQFFTFCSRRITDEGYLFHKYRPDGSLGSSWHSWLKHGHIQLPIQEDEIALVLDALWKHFQQHGKEDKIKPLLDSFIRKAADFMLGFMDPKTGLPNESYDLWEEKLGIHTFTCSTVYAGFQAAANFEEHFGDKKKADQYRKAAEKVKKAILKYLWDEERGYFLKMVYYDGDVMKKDYTLDMSSAYGVFQFGVLDSDDDKIKRSFDACLNQLQLKTEVGGLARYQNDYYYKIDENTPGNPWFITTLWLAEYYIHRAYNEEMLKPAIEIFKWVAKHKLSTGVLSEQLHPHDGSPVSVAPLTWSHAGFVIAINKYLERLDNLGVCKMCNPPKMK